MSQEGGERTRCPTAADLALTRSTLIAALCLAVSAGGGLTVRAAADEIPGAQFDAVRVVRWSAAWLKTYDEDGNYREGVPISALPPLPAQIRRIDLEHRRIAIEITMSGRSPVLRYVDLSVATLSSPLPFVRPFTDPPGRIRRAGPATVQRSAFWEQTPNPPAQPSRRYCGGCAASTTRGR